MLFPVWLSHVSRACMALSKHGVGVEPPFWPDFWDRGRACARGGGVHDQRPDIQGHKRPHDKMVGPTPKKTAAPTTEKMEPLRNWSPQPLFGAGLCCIVLFCAVWCRLVLGCVVLFVLCGAT